MLNLRAVVGIVASFYLGLATYFYVEATLIACMTFGAGWGLAMLYGVQFRGLVKGEQSASWSGALLASSAWTAMAAPLLLGIYAVPKALDLSTLGLGSIYIAAKIGCHRIGCCDWDKKGYHLGASLPHCEIGLTLAILTATTWLLIINAPTGVAWLLFTSLHVTTWTFLKKFRAAEN